mmetsp:Transcript_8433/g.13989  ORF Transcript_8433/g.13989 Transcript_8433/m.13989 type:complete len:243 (-) Transcript_8433:434-1162(-)
MLKNFSMPISAPKPASVTQKPSSPTILSASWSATTEELPWAMLANGPACTNTGVCSTVCMAVGARASFISTHKAPPTPRSSVVIGSPALLMPTTMLPRRSRMSAREVVSASTAITSEATVMSKADSRGKFSDFPCPVVMPRRNLSQTSSTRFHVMVEGSMSRRAKRPFSSSENSLGSVFVIPSFFNLFIMIGVNFLFPSLSAGQRRENKDLSLWFCSWYMRVSIAADTKLLAAPTAWMSPVK